MLHQGLRRVLAAFVSLTMVASLALPTLALASEQVSVDNHAMAADGKTTVRDVVIDGVDAPQPGSALDNTATVTCADGQTWDIAVLWLDQSVQLATEAAEGGEYLPALAYFVPQEYAVDASGSYTVTLSDSLTELFGGQEIISIYDVGSGITYILPASIRSFFEASRTSGQGTTEAGGDAAAGASASDASASGDDDQARLVDIYCAQTARDAFSDDELEWLLDLIINRLHPQAVNLLLDAFPSFKEAAQNGQIGTQIGMYVYYKSGDQDGIAEHQAALPKALAYVADAALPADDSATFHYLLGIDLSSLVETDKDGKPIKDAQTGKFRLVRDGEDMRTFENTIVHELFHALMDDYNRTGMAGATNMADVITDEDNRWIKPGAGERFDQIHFPMWFVEGSASTVENVFQFRIELFDMLRIDPKNPNAKLNTYTAESIYNTYMSLYKYKDEKQYFDLSFCNGGVDTEGNQISNVASAYVSGYLATLFLGELAARKDAVLGSAITQTDTSVSVNSYNIRMGFDSILNRLHHGETLDQIINDISPTAADGTKLYKDTDDFQEKFIKGPGTTEADGQTYYQGDNDEDGSLAFVTTFLNHLYYFQSRGQTPNGSMILNFDEAAESPLDSNKTDSTDYLKIVESNRFVESTVPDSEALKGGGKSVSGTTTEGSADAAATSTVASTDAQDAKAQDADDDSKTNEQDAQAQATSDSDKQGSATEFADKTDADDAQTEAASSSDESQAQVANAEAEAAAADSQDSTQLVLAETEVDEGQDLDIAA